MLRPGEARINEFERALLECIIADNPNFGLSRATFRVRSRTLTGVGSFTQFVTEGWTNATERLVLNMSKHIAMPGVPHGLGCVAFLERNELTLETYCYDDEWDGRFDGFELVAAKEAVTASNRPQIAAAADDPAAIG